jgi:hypothetical protein
MKTNTGLLLKRGLLTALIVLTTPANALEKPKTMEDMWKIIQAQQKQIEALQAKAPATSVKTESTGDVKVLERKTDVLSQEVEKLRTNLAIPEETKYKSMYGLGPAASKIYAVGKGLSIGGYGEANYQAQVGDRTSAGNNADFERMVLYAGYKFTDNILFNSEIEFEHGSTANGGTVSVEFAALDFFIDPMVNIRAGMLLMPMGFINQIHEPPFYFGNNRPEVERQIIPSTWREIGVGLFGQLTPELSYTAYGVGGMSAANYGAAGIRSGRQNGAQAKAEDIAFVGRLDYTPEAVPGLSVGASAYLGNAGQNQVFENKVTKVKTKADVFTQLYEAHAQWKYRGLEVRALGSWGHVGDADILSAAKGTETIGSDNYGWYAEAGYDVLPLMFNNTTQALLPFFRYEHFDTIASAPTGFADDLSKDKEIYQVGLHYKPIPNVVIKADYRNISNKKGTPEPDDFNLGFGFIF